MSTTRSSHNGHHPRTCIPQSLTFLLGVFLIASLPAAASILPRPNILWITAEDINPHLGCYGDPDAVTPNLDRFATRSLRYLHVWSVAPVCAPARTAIITGMYPASTGGQHMRSDTPLPTHIRMFPEYLRDLGYYCSNNSKEDYNHPKPAKVWDDSSTRAHWTNRAPGQPFFAVFNLTISHESQIRNRPHTLRHNPDTLHLPPYHPDRPEVRRDWAQYHDRISEMDAQFEKRLAELHSAGLADDTIVFFFGDNGSGMPRSKRWPYNSGLHVPMLIRIPPRFQTLAPRDYRDGGTTARLVSFVDLAPTLLSLVGMRAPAWMQGHAFLGPHTQPGPRYLFGYRDRMDERYDLTRSVRDERFIYIRNYYPNFSQGEFLEYMFQTPTTRVWNELYRQNALTPVQSAFWRLKPVEEFYDLATDPFETTNLVTSASHAVEVARLRKALDRQAETVRDTSFLPEPDMLSRASNATVNTFARSRKQYPLTTIRAQADRASSLDDRHLPALRRGLHHRDPAVRYWSAAGFLMRGTEAVLAHSEALEKLLQDTSPSARIMAAWALAKHGSRPHQTVALRVLEHLTDPASQDFHTSLLAMNAIENLGPVAAPIHEALRSFPTNTQFRVSNRVADNWPKLHRRILETSRNPVSP